MQPPWTAIPWTSLGLHVSGRNTEIPGALYALSAPDRETRQKACTVLFGEGQDHGDIYDTTPAILTCVIDLLHQPETPDRPLLLSCCAAIAMRLLHLSGRHDRFTEFRLHLATYDALKAGLPLYHTLLNDADLAVQLATLDLMQYLTEDRAELIPMLLEAFQAHPQVVLGIAILQTLKQLLQLVPLQQSELRQLVTHWLQEVIVSDHAIALRTAAASAAVACVQWYDWRFDQFFPTVPDLLITAFLAVKHPEPDRALQARVEAMHASHAFSDDPMTESEQRDWETYQDYCFDLWEAEHTRERIVQDLAQLPPAPLLALLQNPAILSFHTHLIVRGLLIHAFGSSTIEIWYPGGDPNDAPSGIYYGEYHPSRRQSLHHEGRHVLRHIINAPKAWEIPTNVFSFFYGLPDTRTELEALLNELGA